MEIVVCSHGDFGKELIRSAEMIVGNIKDIKSFSLLPSMSIEEYVESIRSSISKDKDYLFLVDLFGGTPSNATTLLMKDYRINMVTGVNLACLLEISMAVGNQNYTHEELMDLAKRTIEDSPKAISYKGVKEVA